MGRNGGSIGSECRMRFWRNWHRTVSLVIALPFAVTLLTGLLLSIRGFSTWVQPEYARPNGGLTLSFERILEISKTVPEARIDSWGDVSQIDVRPSAGNIRVRSRHAHWEIQIDGQDGRVLTSAPRRVSWLVALHEGAYFGSWVRYGLFLPSALGVLFLLASGLVLAVRPKAKAAAAARTTTMTKKVQI